MRIEYNMAFQVDISHGYFGEAADFIAAPTLECALKLKDYALVFKNTRNGFAVFYEAAIDDSGKVKPKRPIEREEVFAFALISPDPHFLNYTKLPLEAPFGGIYRLTNLSGNVKDGALILSSDITSDCVTGMDRILLKGRFFYHAVKTQNASVRAEVKDSLGKTVFDEELGAQEGVCNCPVDVRGFCPGLFSLHIDGKKEFDFYASDELVRKSAFGVVDVFKSAGVPDAYRFTDTGSDVAKKKYEIRFERRSTFWRYYVVLKYRQNISGPELSIKSSSPAVSFTSLGKKTLSDGSAAFVFVSDAELPLQKAGINGVRLEKPGADAFKIENLPGASVTSITPEGGKVFSDIYVYV